MTRLKTEWIEYMVDGMDAYNRMLKKKTGMDLGGLIRRTFDMDSAAFEKAKAENRAAVIPITQGEGIIGQFSESVASIIRSIGFDTIVTEHTDVDGIYDAYLAGCNLLFFADDIRYLALNTRNGKASDNNYATALGFIRVLEVLMENCGRDIHQEKILQIGYGLVGKEAVKILEREGIDFDLFDRDPSVTEGLPYDKLTGNDQIRDYQYILDFTNEGGWMKKEHLNEGVLYASPGVPYSMDEDAARCFEDKAVHDNLEIGTAVMLGEAIL